MVKRLLALLLATILLLSLCACKKKQPEPVREAPESAEEMAVRFIRAYYLKDYHTQFSLCIYDARQHWIDHRLAGQTIEEFCQEAQRQADEKGMSVNIQTLDDYFTEFYNVGLVQLEEMYGEHTISAEVTSSTKMDEAALTDLLGDVSSGFFGDYVEQERLDKVTEGYKVIVDFHIDGEKRQYNQSYDVSAVLCDGQWLVAGHTS